MKSETVSINMCAAQNRWTSTPTSNDLRQTKAQIDFGIVNLERELSKLG
jgi:hypothetical protein